MGLNCHVLRLEIVEEDIAQLHRDRNSSLVGHFYPKLWVKSAKLEETDTKTDI